MYEETEDQISNMACALLTFPLRDLFKEKLFLERWGNYLIISASFSASE